VHKALDTLRFVEQKSIYTDVGTREVRFNLSDKKAFNEDDVRKALKDQGFKEVNVKTAPSSK
jgi:hypothetical protein